MFKKKPFFIVFEGVEGCGKSYQSKKLLHGIELGEIQLRKEIEILYYIKIMVLMVLKPAILL